jgi:hypothetical protein
MIMQQVNLENSHRSSYFDQLFSSANLSSDFIGSVRLDFPFNASLIVLRGQSNPDGSYFMTSTPPQIINSTSIEGTWQFTSTSAISGNSNSGSVTIQQGGYSISGSATFSNNPCFTTAVLSGLIYGNSMILQLQEGSQAIFLTGFASNTEMEGLYTTPIGGCTQGDYGTWIATQELDPYDGNWAGSTSQNQNMSMTIANNDVTAYLYTVNFSGLGLGLNCPTSETVTSGSATLIPITGSSFSSSEFSGTFQSSTQASGTVNWTLSLPGCNASGTFTWNATKQ